MTEVRYAMIPETPRDLAKLAERFENQTTRITELFDGLSPDTLRWRPTPQKWSIAGHVAHLCITSERYAEAMRECLDRNSDLAPSASYKHPWTGRLFAKLMAPPVRRPMKTTGGLVPDPALDGDDTLLRFGKIQEELIGIVNECRGTNPGKARFGSPFLRILRHSLGTGLATLEAHNRRHIGLARNVLNFDGFPG